MSSSEVLEELRRLRQRLNELILTQPMPPGWRHNPKLVKAVTITTTGATKKLTVLDTLKDCVYKQGFIVSGYVALNGAQAPNVRHRIRVEAAPLEFNFTQAEMAVLGFPTTPVVNMFWYSNPAATTYYTIFSSWSPWLPWKGRVLYELDNEGTASVTHEETLYAIIEYPVTEREKAKAGLT